MSNQTEFITDATGQPFFWSQDVIEKIRQGKQYAEWCDVISDNITLEDCAVFGRDKKKVWNELTILYYPKRNVLYFLSRCASRHHPIMLKFITDILTYAQAQQLPIAEAMKQRRFEANGNTLHSLAI